HPNDNLEQVTIGTEYKFSDYFALRAGYRMFLKVSDKDAIFKFDANTEVDVEEPLEGLSFGLGMNVPLGNMRTLIDYAYTDMGFLDLGQRFTIAFQF
ncbi:hypothetical protein JW964_18120, partial [candidate division KSB1 bacterium]|nr:hypothetical protein [candidate division KSB1 bacterium]